LEAKEAHFLTYEENTHNTYCIWGLLRYGGKHTLRVQRFAIGYYLILK